MAVRSYPIRHPLDLRLTLAPLARGPYDPTIRFSSGRAWRATRTPDGPATVAMVHGGDALRVEAWGPGADRALDDIPALLGLDLEPEPIPNGHPLVAHLARRDTGIRIPRTTAVLESLIPAILEQKVTSDEAHRATIGLIRVHGEMAPGPSEIGTSTPAGAGDARRPPLLRLPPVRHRASPSRAHPARRLEGVLVRGDRGPAAPRCVRAADRRPGDRAMDRGRGRRPGARRCRTP